MEKETTTEILKRFTVQAGWSRKKEQYVATCLPWTWISYSDGNLFKAIEGMMSELKENIQRRIDAGEEHIGLYTEDPE